MPRMEPAEACIGIKWHPELWHWQGSPPRGGDTKPSPLTIFVPAAGARRAYPRCFGAPLMLRGEYPDAPQNFLVMPGPLERIGEARKQAPSVGDGTSAEIEGLLKNRLSEHLSKAEPAKIAKTLIADLLDDAPGVDHDHED